MMFCLVHDAARKNCIEAVKTAPNGFVVTIKQKTRSLEANAKMWALLADISEQVVWHGRRFDTTDWKHILSASLKKQQVVPGIDGNLVVLGQSTSKMAVSEMSDLIELIHAFGAQNGVKFGL